MRRSGCKVKRRLEIWRRRMMPTGRGRKRTIWATFGPFSLVWLGRARGTKWTRQPAGGGQTWTHSWAGRPGGARPDCVRAALAAPHVPAKQTMARKFLLAARAPARKANKRCRLLARRLISRPARQSIQGSQRRRRRKKRERGPSLDLLAIRERAKERRARVFAIRKLQFWNFAHVLSLTLVRPLLPARLAAGI